MTRKAVVLDIRIILVNSVLHAKQKGFAEQAVHTNLLTNAACALNAPYIVPDIKELGIHIVIQCLFTAHQFIYMSKIDLMKRLPVFN